MKHTYVPAYGDTNAKLAGCGEQPGHQEVRARPPRPFIGPAGQGLDECLLMTKIPRHELYLTNVIKDLDKPLAAYIDLDTRGKWTVSAEGLEYINELGRELRALNLNIIIAFGNIALLALCNRVGITKWRGSVLESTLVPGLKVIPTFHPATFIPPKFNYLNKSIICEDLLRAKYESQFKDIRRTPRSICTRPDFNQTINTLRHIYRVGRLGQLIGIDIEVINGEVDCIGLSWSPTESICIPFRFSGGDYFTVEQELSIMRGTAYIIQAEDIQKTGASFIFDTQFLFHKYGIVPRGSLHCTQIAQKISYPDFPAGLAAVTTMYTDIPYYKEDGKQWMKMGSGTWEEWWNYNGVDALVPVEAIPKQLETLRRQKNTETYERQRKLIKPLLYMGERGIKVDVGAMVDYEKEQHLILDELDAQLKEEVGRDINYNSPKQLMEYFYKELGHKPYKKKNTQGIYSDSIDVDALKRLVRQGGKGSQAARIMLDIRGLSKRISTYLDIGKVDKDGRYRSSYKPVGADTGRLSSGETIFGTGGNQQNWPHDLLRFFLFDEGYIGYSFDLSQIENRIVAYTGGVLAQIDAFERGIDLHTLTASIIFHKP
jgi:uracil-DNA glycosylase family 4